MSEEEKYFDEALARAFPKSGMKLRNFLVSGQLNDGTFSITISCRKHVSVRDVYEYFTGNGIGIKTIHILNIYEFKDEADFLDYKGEK